MFLLMISRPNINLCFTRLIHALEAQTDVQTADLLPRTWVSPWREDDELYSWIGIPLYALN
jgi:hypothetical protein